MAAYWYKEPYWSIQTVKWYWKKRDEILALLFYRVLFEQPIYTDSTCNLPRGHDFLVSCYQSIKPYFTGHSKSAIDCLCLLFFTMENHISLLRSDVYGWIAAGTLLDFVFVYMQCRWLTSSVSWAIDKPPHLICLAVRSVDSIRSIGAAAAAELVLCLQFSFFFYFISLGLY